MSNIPGEIYCPYCKSRNVSDSDIGSSRNVADKKIILYKCGDCSRTFTEKLLRNHEQRDKQQD